MPVNTPRKDYDDMHSQWSRLRDCFNGRDAVLKAGNKYVPDLPGATTAQNIAYRYRGNFYNATKRTVQGLSGAIFQKPPVVVVPTTITDLLDDVTLAGVTFEMFAGDAGREVMLLGRHGVLIDFPAAVEGQSAHKARPYCIGYKAEDIINWRTERHGGDDKLTMVILHEVTEVSDPEDPFVCKVLNQFRVIELIGASVIVNVWREKDDNAKEFQIIEGPIVPTRRGKPLDFIPFVFIGSEHATPDLESPPLIDLADVNLSHWRNSVDHEYGLHLVALPTPWVAGVKGASDGPMKIGPSVVWELDVSGHAGMLEFTGNGLKAIVEIMEAKVKQMATLGARVFEEPTRGDTATAVLVRHSGEHASLRTIAGSMEQGLTLVLQMMGWWAGTEAELTDVKANVELNKEYLDIKATAQEVQVALTALQAGEISFDTWWDLISTGGWGREGITADDELKAIKERRAMAPEPVLDPALSPGDQNPSAHQVALVAKPKVPLSLKK